MVQVGAWGSLSEDRLIDKVTRTRHQNVTIGPGVAPQGTFFGPDYLLCLPSALMVRVWGQARGTDECEGALRREAPMALPALFHLAKLLRICFVTAQLPEEDLRELIIR